MRNTGTKGFPLHMDKAAAEEMDLSRYMTWITFQQPSLMFWMMMSTLLVSGGMVGNRREEVVD